LPSSAYKAIACEATMIKADIRRYRSYGQKAIPLIMGRRSSLSYHV
jgi:hypothetical protein